MKFWFNLILLFQTKKKKKVWEKKDIIEKGGGSQEATICQFGVKIGSALFLFLSRPIFIYFNKFKKAYGNWHFPNTSLLLTM